ncbi:MAG: RNA polymerase sigma factor [Xanthomonadales bacterium]|nr:RNA polymerase sigma factor [Xanthomonadales bacterium]
MSLNDTETRLREALREFGPMLLRVAMSYEADPALREDLLQEITFSIWKALPSFRGDASLKTFVARVAHNRAVDHVMQRQRILDRYSEGGDPAGLARNPSRTGPEQHDLTVSIRNLPLAYRQCIELMLEGFTHAEIAEALGLAENAVSQRLVRGRRQLKNLLSKEDSNER